MDRITRAFLEQFRDEQSLSKELPEADLFELFAIHCVVSNVHGEEFDASGLAVAGANDLGIDGIAIIVNGVLVSSLEEAEDLLRINGYLDVKFVFVQAKTSSSFDGNEISGFLDGVLEFFADNPTLPANQSIQDNRSIMSWIYGRSIKFTRQKPVVEMHYVTTGSWQEDAHLKGIANQRVNRLLETNLFESVSFHPSGATEVQASYQRSKNNVSVEFTFSNKVTLPDIDGVTESYLGYLPFSEYSKLLTDPSGNIRKPLFYDNVRDFQGDNPVNLEIRATLDESTGRQRFAILNNGVTVVTRELRATGNKFTISDYQIVNGCQTSHVLFESRNHLDSATHIPIKVIATADEDIISDIITATNRQTEVTTEDLFAKTAFQKRLESLYDSYPGKKKLYYERRSRQYAAIEGVEKVRIIDKKVQIRAFAAIFLDDAHRSARYYSDLRSQVESGKIFNDDHKLEPYYVSAYAYYKLEYLFRNSQISSYYKPARFHLMMAVRHLIGESPMPALTANKMTSYANRIAEALWSETKAVEYFKLAVEAVDSALAGQSLDKELVKTQMFTDSVKAAAGKIKGELESGTRSIK
ncbi:AIPR family protein [Rhodococcus sp. SJ]|uniref:AIPR family protein n=1 Tax=Rhodococcus sp. SJ TaxID=3434112 RepID=UPI003D7A24E2